MSTLMRKFSISRSIISIKIALVVILILRLYYQLGSGSLKCGVYCNMAREFDFLFAEQKFDSYFLQKSLNSTLAHGLFNILDWPRTAANANILLLAISTFQLFLFMASWAYLCRLRKIHPTIELFGLIVCLVNPIILIYHFSWMEIPDAPLLLVGTWTMIAVTKKSQELLFFLYLLSFAIAPQIRIILLLLLILFPLLWKKGKHTSDAISTKQNLGLVGGSLTALKKVKTIYIFGIFCFLNLLVALLSPVFPDEFGVNFSNVILLPFSIVIASFIYTSLLVRLIRSSCVMLVTISFFLRGISSKVIMLLCIEVLRVLVVDYLGKGPDQAMTSYGKGQIFTLYSWFFHNLIFPGLLIATAVNFFSFGMLILIIRVLHYSKQEIQSSERTVWSTVFLLTFPFLINTEMRHQLFILPVIIILILGHEQLSHKQILIVFASSMLTSRAFTLDVSERSIELGSSDLTGVYLGPWTQTWTYFISLTLSVCFLLIARRVFDLKIGVLLKQEFKLVTQSRLAEK